MILITHDNEIAEQADRVIKIRDGRIVSDTRRVTQAEGGGHGQDMIQEKGMEDEENE